MLYLNINIVINDIYNKKVQFRYRDILVFAYCCSVNVVLGANPITIIKSNLFVEKNNTFDIPIIYSIKFF